MFYSDPVGSRLHEREYRRTCDAYLAAVHRLLQAMTRWQAAGPPLESGPRGEIVAWTPDQISAAINAATAWQALVSRRLEYESAIRDYRRPERRSLT